MNTTNILHGINTLAAGVLEEHGWTQGKMEAEDGRLCLVGALRRCSPQPGDWILAREVYRRLGHAEHWNDAKGRTAEEVMAWLRSHPVTDADLEDTFGPQWEAIVRLVRQAATLKRNRARELNGTIWSDDWHCALDAAWAVARDAAVGAGRDRDANWANTRGVVTDAVRTAVERGSRAKVAAELAAAALAVADLVGQHGLNQEHIDTLLGPWISAVGDPRLNGVVYTGEGGVSGADA